VGAFILFALAGGAQCATGRSQTATTNLRGQRVEVLAVWTGTEQSNFQRVLRAFEAKTGASVTFTPAGHSVPETLATRLAAARPPDLAFLPQPGLLRAYAADHSILPLDASTASVVNENYDAVWRRLGSVDGRLYGVWFKAANKSLVWYNVGVFERTGVVPPTDLDGLLADARAFSKSGVPAFSVAGADAWTLTDWFENLYLRMAGPTRYDLLASHRIPWTDPSVVETLDLFDKVLDPSLIAGGVAGALRTGYEASVEQTFSPSPAAAMVFEGDFVAGVIDGNTHAKLGVDADVFPFPAAGAADPAVVGGGDIAVLMRRSSAGDALIRYLSTPEAGTLWARQGGFISPNRNVDLSVYPDEISRSLARRVLEAGDDFRFDLSDLQPASFGSSSTTGMRPRLRALLTSHDVNGTAAALEADASAAYRG
jgi:ABC-type glycerol-3-phosphate transport system substrate-binding protein